MAKQNRKKYYYRDEVNDDFAAIEIKPTHLTDEYRYVDSTKKIYWTISQIFRFTIAMPILALVSKIVYHTTVKNKKAFKEVKDKGYFLMSNHTTAFDPINHAVLCDPKKFTCIIASVETFSIKGLAGLIHYLGAIPVPLSPKMYRNFHDALKFHIEANHKVLVYPEAHIWPYYNRIRPFKSVSFRYAVEFDTPIMVATTTFKKRRFCKRPKTIIHIDGPIYPDAKLTFKDQIQDLRDKTYDIMASHANQDDNYATYDFIKIEDGNNQEKETK